MVRSPAPSSADLRAIAYHEAGHVVVGTLLGLEVLDTDIDRDGEGGRGHTHFAPRKRERDFVERVVATFMAGFAAEDRLGAADPEGSGYDMDLLLREWIGYLEPDPARRPAVAEQFFARAAELLSDPKSWQAVEVVAAALLQAGRLDGNQARELVKSA
jgi:hypothetical protein